ncbi:MAG: LysM peptidoglycan-binding domain-containing protein [Bacteroidales bacterium]|nr:LysM peptidoglycan-binding domain-containing protein [Bacteroidales bacterium]
MKRFFLIAALILGFQALGAQEVTPVPVKVSTDMVRKGDHLFYAHVVVARQTLYSIGKAYGVSTLDIIDANPKLDLHNKPIHPGDVLLIPVRIADLKAPEPEPSDTLAAPVDSLTAPVDSVPAPSDTLAPVDTLAPADTLAPLDSLAMPVDSIPAGPVRPAFVYDYVDRIHVALLLPLAADAAPNQYYMNFYFGALLAARDLGAEDIEVDLTVIDVSSAKDFGRVGKVLEQSDVIIGPVSTADIQRTLPLLPEGKFIVSPMDPKTEPLVAEHPVILAATPASTQIADAVSWMKSDMAPADSLIIVRESGYPMSANSQLFVSEIDPESISNRVEVSYALSEGIKMNEDFFAYHTHLKDTVTWVVAASEHDVFVSDVIRNVALQNYMGHNTYIYGPAKTKSQEVDEMCGARLHQSATYHINYDDPAVIRFVKDFRALFQDEPDNFAFHGYDTVKYFVTACENYGRNWQQKLDDFTMSGLQTNFKFAWDPESVGDINSGIRRVVYSPGYKISVQK